MTAMADGDALWGKLENLFDRLDPVPPTLVEQVSRAFCWRTVDAELAELSFDSLVDGGCALAVRSDGSAEPRLLGFGAVVDGQELAIELEVSAAGGRCALLGQLWPAGADSVEVQSGDGTSAAVPADEVGRFLVESVPVGPVRLRFRHGGRFVQTTWVSYARG